MKAPSIGLFALVLAFAVACSSAEPPEELAAEGVFVPAEETPSDFAMHRGGPTRTGIYDTAGVLEEPEVKWTFKADRKVATSPAVLEDRVVFGSDAGSLYAVDVDTGEELWKFDSGLQIGSSPLVADGFVYFGNHVGSLYALNLGTGAEVWSFKANGAITASPVTVGGTVYFGTGVSNFYALDARTGLMNWQKDLRQGESWVSNHSSPAVSGDMVYQVSVLPGSSGSSSFNVIDRQNGDILWSLEIDGAVVDTLAVSGGAALVSTFGYRIDGWVHAIDLDTQQHRWVYKAEDRAKIRTSPAVSEGLVLFGDSKGRLIALDFETGELEWSFESGTDFLTSLTVADLLVYFADVDGLVVAVDLITGIERWRFQTELARSAPTNCDGTFTCGSFSTVVRSGVLYIGNPAGYLYALEYRPSTSDIN